MVPLQNLTLVDFFRGGENDQTANKIEVCNCHCLFKF